jgi:RimJ/RimL family protein N-acetyltransferase
MPGLTPVTLATPRLRLRWLTCADAPAQSALFADPVLRRYGGSPPWTEHAQAEAAVAGQLAAYADGSSLLFAITLAATGEVIGNTRLFDFFDQNRRAELGYILGQGHQGQGYMREALTATLDYAFGALALNRVEADVDPRNTASRRALERLGFQQEGYLRERWIVGGEVCDTVLYGLLQRDWQARAGQNAPTTPARAGTGAA